VLIGLDPGLGAGGAIGLVDGVAVAALSWAPTRALRYEAQATAAALMFSQFPEARLVYEQPHKRRGRSIATYGGLMRSIGIWLAAYPRRSVAVAPAKWRSELGMDTRADDLKLESLAECASWILSDPDSDPNDLMKRAISQENDHVVEAALVARWFRVTRGRGRR